MTTLICRKDEKNHLIFGTKEVSLTLDKKNITGRRFMRNEHSCKKNDTSLVSLNVKLCTYTARCK